MIINFSVENFRSIKDKITLSFEPTHEKNLSDYYIVEPKKGLKILKLGIIYGPNASGKTNILRAIGELRKLVLDPAKTKTSKLTHQPFLFDEQTPHLPTKFEIEFFHKGTRFIYAAEYNSLAVLSEQLYYFNPRRALIYERQTDLEKKLASIKFGSKIKINKDTHNALINNTLWNNTVLGGYLKTNLQIDELDKVIQWFKQKFNYFIHPGFPFDILGIIFWEKHQLYKKIFIEILQKADFSIKDFTIEEKIIQSKKKTKGNVIEKLPYIYHKKNGKTFKLPLQEESNGTRQYLGYAGILLHTLIKNKILIIDELETSLHPDLIKHFLLTFLVNSTEAQLITTTHYRELLMEKNILRRDIIWFTELKDDLSTDLFSLADFDTKVFRKENSIYNFYKIGRLGAVPKLGDYYLNLNYGKEDEK